MKSSSDLYTLSIAHTNMQTYAYMHTSYTHIHNTCTYYTDAKKDAGLAV